jgi:hypothetical protein
MYKIVIDTNGVRKVFETNSIISNENSWYKELPVSIERPSIKLINDSVSMLGSFNYNYKNTYISVRKNTDEC